MHPRHLKSELYNLQQWTLCSGTASLTYASVCASLARAWARCNLSLSSIACLLAENLNSCISLKQTNAASEPLWTDCSLKTTTFELFEEP